MRSGGSIRFEEKKAAVLDAASDLIDRYGAGGMTLSAVADAVGLTTASVTYYYKRRDDLAAACYHQALDRLEEQVAIAAKEAEPRSRVRRLVELNVELLRGVRNGTVRPIITLAEIRALGGAARGDLAERYRAFLRNVRALFDWDGSEQQRQRLVVRVHVLVENLYWMTYWIGHFADHSLDRVTDQVFDMFERGIAAHSAGGAGEYPPFELNREDETAPPKTRFLLAATELLNRNGYKGASVDKIAAFLNVTKGSFYHHLDAKDDLVLSCFENSLETVIQAQKQATAIAPPGWNRFDVMMRSLVALQLSDRPALLRTSALQAIGQDHYTLVLEKLFQGAWAYSGFVSDAIADGRCRPVDPMIAGLMSHQLVNCSYELRNWASSTNPPEAVEECLSTLYYGLFD